MTETIVTDIAQPLNWDIAIGFQNTIVFTFVDSNGAPFDVSGYSFSIKIRKRGTTTETVLLTQSTGITNNGVLGTVVGSLTKVKSETLKRAEYFWETVVIHPDGLQYRWYKGIADATREEGSGPTNTALTNTIAIAGTTITATISLGAGGGGGALTDGRGTTANGTAVDLGGSVMGIAELSIDDPSAAFSVKSAANPTLQFSIGEAAMSLSVPGVGPSGAITLFFDVATGTLKVTDTRGAGSAGIEYAADYSAEFTDRSLVDKGYADSIAGGQLTITAVKTGTYAAAANEFVPFDLSSGNGVLNLPTAPANGTRVGTRLTLQGLTTRTLTINRGGSDTIENGATSRILTTLSSNVVYQYESSTTTWRAISDANPFNSVIKALFDITTPVADQFPYFTSSTVAALAPLTAFIRTLLDDPDAAAARTTLGVMERVVLTGSSVVNNNATPDTMQDVTGLQFPVVAGTYFFMFSIKYTSAAASTGSGWGINGPTLVSLGMYTLNTLTASTGSMRTESAYDGHTVNATSIMGANNMALMWGIITVSASGNVIARFSSEVAGSAITALGGGESMVQFLKIA